MHVLVILTAIIFWSTGEPTILSDIVPDGKIESCYRLRDEILFVYAHDDSVQFVVVRCETGEFANPKTEQKA